MKSIFDGIKRVHFVGIGGAGMSGLAHILLRRGASVTGSDICGSDLIESLRKKGAEVNLGHKRENINSAQLVIYSQAVVPSNPELVEARNLGIEVIPRAQALAELMKEKIDIGVVGAHGKTTTTSLISVVLAKAGLAPTVSIGGVVKDLGLMEETREDNTNTEFFVAEIDESDGSFLNFAPAYTVVTNIDKEHLDFYRNLSEIQEAYKKFLLKTKRCLFACGDDPHLAKILAGYKGRLRTFGMSCSSDIFAEDAALAGYNTSFRAKYKNRDIGTFRLNIPGLHNISNSLAAIGIGIELGIRLDVIREALFSFRGADRRFELKFEGDGIMVIEDYAHHPTEIKATIAAAKTWQNKRLLVVFQPHRYTRTKYLKEEFGACFAGADALILTDIYAASEAPIQGVDIGLIVDSVRSSGEENVLYLKKDKIADHIAQRARSGDMILVLGAGDIGAVSDAIAQKLDYAVTKKY